MIVFPAGLLVSLAEVSAAEGLQEETGVPLSQLEGSGQSKNTYAF